MKIGTIASGSLSEPTNKSINNNPNKLRQDGQGVRLEQPGSQAQQAERVSVDSRLSVTSDPERQAKIDTLKKRIAEESYRPDTNLVATALTKEIDDTIRALR
jgi:anti-sigma28 factor (negative regulator of flagellin synthesis)